MEYRLCVFVDNEKKKSAYAFYNQQEFCVYKRVVDALEEDNAHEYVRVCQAALIYFCKNVKNRYYTEHFSELLDEDKGIVLSTEKAVVDAFLACRNGGAQIPRQYLPLAEYFAMPSVSFEYSPDSPLIKRTAELI